MKHGLALSLIVAATLVGCAKSGTNDPQPPPPPYTPGPGQPGYGGYPGQGQGFTDGFDNQGEIESAPIVGRVFTIFNSGKNSASDLQMTAEGLKSGREMTRLKQNIKFFPDAHMSVGTEFRFDNNGQLSFQATVNGVRYVGNNISYRYIPSEFRADYEPSEMDLVIGSFVALGIGTNNQALSVSETRAQLTSGAQGASRRTTVGTKSAAREADDLRHEQFKKEMGISETPSANDKQAAAPRRTLGYAVDFRIVGEVEFEFLRGVTIPTYNQYPQQYLQPYPQYPQQPYPNQYPQQPQTSLPQPAGSGMNMKFYAERRLMVEAPAILKLRRR